MSLGTRMLAGTLLIVFAAIGLLVGPDRAGAVMCLLLLAAGVWVVYAAYERGRDDE